MQYRHVTLVSDHFIVKLDGTHINISDAPALFDSKNCICPGCLVAILEPGKFSIVCDACETLTCSRCFNDDDNMNRYVRCFACKEFD